MPRDVPPGALLGKLAVAVDILRAGTTIAAALDSGASRVIPCESVDEVKSTAGKLENPLLGGERHCVKIEGFDLSNSPEAYRSDVVGGRPVVFTTTNGTLAIRACQEAAMVLVGSFSNLAAVCQRLQDRGLPVAIICAGTNGNPTLEDVLFGGAITHCLAGDGGGRKIEMNPAARSASELWRTALRQMAQGRTLYEILCETEGGRNLVQLGLESDIEFASQIDRYDSVPVCDCTTGMIESDVDLSASHR